MITNSKTYINVTKTTHISTNNDHAKRPGASGSGSAGNKINSTNNEMNNRPK